MPVQPGLRRRRRVGRNEAGIAVGKCHDEKMRPILDAGDDRIRLAQSPLEHGPEEGQRHKHLTPTKAPFPNVILHDGLFAREAMFVAKALEYTLRRVVLLTVNRSVLLQNTVDDIREGASSGVSVAGVADIPAVPNAAASSSPSRAQCQTDLPPLAGSDHQHGRPAERADIGPRCTSSRLPSQKRSKACNSRSNNRPRKRSIN